MKLREAILANWETDIVDHTQIINVLEKSGFPGWTVRFVDSYGVAIPYTGNDEINEKFANARIQSTTMELSGEKEARKVLLLLSSKEAIKQSFSSLCEAFLEPGDDGELRNDINSSPIAWWRSWKELLGNRNVDERIYDTLGELCALKYIISKGEDAEWNGPNGASYDIETPQRFVEVKSSINRDKREVTISSQFQLFPPDKPLDLILCRFEPTVFNGMSIDGILLEFEDMGYNVASLNSKLEELGFEKEMSSRKKMFILHEMLQYTVDESFPRITPDSFVGGVMPEGIVKIQYTVDLSGRTPVSLFKEE